MRITHAAPGRLAIPSAVAFFVLTLGVGPRSHGQAPTPAPAQTAASKARSNDLLKSPPFDRITLIDNAVFEVEPVSPRPLPPIDTKKKRNLDGSEIRPVGTTRWSRKRSTRPSSSSLFI